MKIIFTNITHTAVLFFLLVAGASEAFAQNVKTEEWFVADKQVNCTGVAPQKCLVVREVNAPDWKYFYSPIDGFRFSDGYTQKIRVSITPRKNIPADASAVSYKLVRVLSRSKTDGNTLEEAMAQMNNSKSGILTGKRWTLIEINGETVAVDNAFIEFGDKEKRFGAKICNSLGGSYQQSGENLKFSKIVGTLMACPEPFSTIEKSFSGAMEKVTRFEQTDVALVLYAGDTAVLRFSGAAEAVSTVKTLENTKWALTSVEGEKISTKGEIPFLQLDKQKQLFAGNTGCNNLFGKYQANGANIKFSGAGMTKMACLAPEVQQTEAKMTAALEKVNRYEIVNNVLNLYGDDKLLMRLLPLGR